MRRLLLRVRVRHFEAHEEFCFGADGHAEGVLWGGSLRYCRWRQPASNFLPEASDSTRHRRRYVGGARRYGSCGSHHDHEGEEQAFTRKGDAVRPQAHPGNEWLCIFGVSPCKQTLVDCLVQTFRLPAELGLFTHFPDGAAHTARMAHHQPLRQPVSRHRSPLSHHPRYQGLFVGIESATIQ